MAQIAERNLNTMSTNILHSAIGLGDTVICISYYALSFFSHTSHSLSQYLPSFGWPFASDAGRKFAYTNKHTNMKESVCDTKGIRQNKKLVLKRGATSAAWTWFGNEKSSTDQKNVLCKLYCWPHNILFYTCTRIMSDSTERVQGEPHKPRAQTLQEAHRTAKNHKDG